MTAPEIIVFPNAAQITIVRLEAAFTTLAPTAEVHSRVPKERPALFCTVRRGGGPRQTLVTDAAQLDVESWAAKPNAAHDLAQIARGVINAMAGTVQSGVQVYFVHEFSGPALLPDPTSDQVRYVQSFQVSMRGAAA